MINRRDFLQAAIAAAAAAQARPLLAATRQTGVIGANDRIRVGIVGCGNRGNQVATDWMKHKDSVFVAACDVAKDRLDQTAARLGQTQGNTLDTYEDYRRILERKDVDAIFIATPDHWHSPMMIEAVSAGKDVYVEKPVSNEIEPAVKMVEAARQSNRIVQVGLQQRSWHHFQEAAKLFQEGYIGTTVNHCQMCPPGGGGGGFGGRGQQPQTPQEPPPGFNWDLFQGPAKRKPFVPGRRQWRGWYDYGGGNLTDWGVHLTDIMNWYMRGDTKVPLLTSASAQYVRNPKDPERVPDTYAVTWQYDNFVATLSNAMVPGLEDARELYGNYFFGDRGVLLVNRIGYEIRPYAAPQGGRGGRGQNPNAPPPPPPIEAKKFRDPSGMSEVADSSFGSATHRHVRNFLDSMRSRQKPNCDIEVGFNSTLPCLLAIVSVKTSQTVRWDGKAAKTT
ncbi:MAG TPA: Gfo/Idh/MocA family oxidoreductase [Vicinamibacterales bacterium]|nr:Gfo/Idh/MocA family oxidoreductase [Vicinamibacterales bacterium]